MIAPGFMAAGTALLPLVRSLLFPLLLTGGLVVPGWLLGRAFRAPVGLVGAFLGSTVLLMNLILALDAVGAPLDLTRVAAGLTVVCATLTAIARARMVEGERHAFVLAPRTWPAQVFRWWFVPAVIGFSAMVVKVALDPLSGFDTVFRWDFLAQQMQRERSLHFYPAISADDFLHYGWCDGIAPLVSSLYLWVYLSLGRVSASATAPVVIVQGALLFGIVWQLAARRGGSVAGAAACALLSTSSVALWSVAMAQETGLTALSLAAMIWFLERQRDERDRAWSAWAGVAAGTGALAREYGLAFILVGFIALAWWRLPRRRMAQFALAAAAVALPWYLRNWVKTGHPLYSHDFGGIFPVNPIHVEYLNTTGTLHGIGKGDTALMVSAFTGLGLLGIPLCLGLAAGLVRSREFAPWLLAITTVVALWLWSIGKTSGGLIYSMRVLAPALALGAALGGVLLGRIATERRAPWLFLSLAMLALDAGMRSLYLPIDAAVRWWREPPLAWREFDAAAARWRAHPNWAAIVDSAEGRQIVVSDPTCHAILVQSGARAIPLFSPAIRFLFNPETNFGACLARLRAQGVRFVVLTRKNPVNDRQLSLHPFFRALQTAPPAGTAPLYFIYDLYSVELMHVTDSSPPPASRE